MFGRTTTDGLARPNQLYNTHDTVWSFAHELLDQGFWPPLLVCAEDTYLILMSWEPCLLTFPCAVREQLAVCFIAQGVECKM